ncbi:MAG: phosphoglucomutase/phosphomannomutase family protein, partial [Candidatus Caccosoma sp.]|nr:phosphoglucomutase/phosphomannomutase family protein [Candidatus Caccosoma sp.]
MNDIKFGTGGFRGIIADDFTKENVKLIAQALATLMNTTNAKKEIYVGYDYRFASDFAAKWMVETLCANDIKVYISNSATPTPVVMNICKENHCQYGIMITASHNPYYYNGVKLFELDGQDASVEVT